VDPPSSVLNTWEVLSPTRVKIAWDKTRYWIFDIDPTRTKGRINPGAGTLKDNKSMKATGAGNN